MKLDYSERISQFEQPFICGINGFSMENLTYETSYLENSQFQADFYRLASYTRLGEKAAKMAPVKNLAVYRDMNCFEEDCRKHRTSTGGYGYAMSRQDKLANAFARIPSCSYDLVMTPFFKLDSLKRYKVIYIPDDDVLSDEDVATALAFVKQGGGLVLEGASGEKVMEKVKVKGEGEQRNRSSSENGESSAVHLGPSPSPLVPATPTQYGKGKIVWTKDVLTEKVWLNGRKECVESKQKILSLVASVGGEEPLMIDNPSLDGILQSSASGMFLGVFNRGKQKEVGKVSLDSNNQTIKQSNNLFVLDVRTGFRILYTNGFEIAVGPRQCGFYLIGDDAFTAVPETKEAVWYGASAVSTHAHGNRRTAKVDPDFKVRSCVEFVTPAPRNYKGLPSLIERSEKAMLNRYRFCAPEAEMVKKAGKDDLEAWMKACADGVRYYSPAAFSRALSEASYLHVQCDSADVDAVFADCKEELKALLKRGGGILFSRTKPGPNACKFLEEVGVSNPWPSTKGGFPAPAMWSPNVSTNHPFHAAQGSLFNAQCGSTLKFTQWDKEKQYAPFVDKLNTDAALMVVQENVLGTGKVIFTQNTNSFTSWYENLDHGDAVLSFMLGMPVKEHSEKVMQMNGGIGMVVKE